MNVGDGGAGGLGELDGGAQNQGAEQGVEEGDDDVEVLAHVTVVQQVVAVEAEEDAGPLDVTSTRDVHAPVQVFISRVVEHHGGEDANGHRFADQPLHAEHRCNVQYPNGRRIPPSHRDRFFVSFILEMIGLVSPELPMMHDGVSTEGVPEELQWLVHDVFVEEPLEKTAIDHAAQKPDGLPKNQEHRGRLHETLPKATDCSISGEDFL